MSRVVNRGDIGLVSVPRLQPTKTMQINDNTMLTSVSKPVPTGPDAVLINANGDMQKL